MTRSLLTVALLGGAIALAPTAFAQTADLTGLYVGGQVGYSELSGEGETVVFECAPSTGAAAASRIDFAASRTAS